MSGLTVIVVIAFSIFWLVVPTTVVIAMGFHGLEVMGIYNIPKFDWWGMFLVSIPFIWLIATISSSNKN